MTKDFFLMRTETFLSSLIELDFYFVATDSVMCKPCELKA